MKYLVLIGDGMSDYPLKALGGKTPLEAAKTPNMDFLAQNGICGWVNNIPKSMDPGSDVAAMSIFGYDPKKYYTGRGPLEAASLGVKLKPGEVAFRCNLVTVKNGKMESFTAHHIKTAEARKIMETLNRKLGTKDVRFYAGLSYRNLLILTKDQRLKTTRLSPSILRSSGPKGSSKSKDLERIKCTPPHDITGKRIHEYLPKGKSAELLIKLMNESEVLLHEMKTKATMIWPWGQGKAPSMPAFKKKFGKRGVVITAVHLLKGLGKVLGMEVINVPGATGYLDTNYKGKAEYALRALKKNDVVFIHVEAPDEAGHEGNVRHKIKAIEDFDRLVVGTILKYVHRPSFIVHRIMVLPDHPTPIKLMTHTAEAVPFAIYSQGISRNIKEYQGISGIKGFNEKEIRKSRLKIREGHRLLNLLFSPANFKNFTKYLQAN